MNYTDPKVPARTESPATIYDVAKNADVSIASVSRVLNDYTSVSDSMRRRVTASMRELEYQPNEVARSLGRRSKRRTT